MKSYRQGVHILYLSTPWGGGGEVRSFSMKKILWLDDFRNPKDYLNGDYDIVWVKDYEEFCHHIDNNGLPDIICFDHDLGYEKSGYDCAKYPVHYCQQNNLDIPQYDIQSSNVVGKDNIRSLLENWHRVFINK